MKSYIFTGVSGSGRIELLSELSQEIARRGKAVQVFDIGKMIFEAARELKVHVTEKKILDLDRNVLTSLREIALLKARIAIQDSHKDFSFVGIHATFRWRGRLIDGINFHNLKDLDIAGFVNVVDDVDQIIETNSRNPKWEDWPRPDAEETNNWMMEEEFVSDLLSDMFNVPMYVVGRNHTITNLADLFLTGKPKIYLSYPITAIHDEDPGLLEIIHKEMLPQLEARYIVFNPLVIKDLEKSGTMQDFSPEVIAGLNVRTIVRDYRFIDQSDFVVVVYLTQKISPGVMSEIIYASTHGKPVYMVFPPSFKKSPFLLEYTTVLFDTFEDLLGYLDSSEFKRRVVPENRGFAMLTSA